jgi:hypothetical protein
MNDDKKKYDGWLVSDSLLKRSMAVYGHTVVANFTLMLPFIAGAILMMIADTCH